MAPVLHYLGSDFPFQPLQFPLFFGGGQPHVQLVPQLAVIVDFHGVLLVDSRLHARAGVGGGEQGTQDGAEAVEGQAGEILPELLEAADSLCQLLLRKLVVPGVHQAAVEQGVGGDYGCPGAGGVVPQPLPEPFRISVAVTGAQKLIRGDKHLIAQLFRHCRSFTAGNGAVVQGDKEDFPALAGARGG